MDPPRPDPYAVLGVPSDASLLEIARARRRLAKEFHPDVGISGDDARMQQINAAWRLLSDPAARRTWDDAQARARRVRAYAHTGQPDAGAYAYGGPAATQGAGDRSGGNGGWIVLVATCLLLLVIVVGGVLAAIDGPSMPGRDSPVLQDNLDQVGD